MKEFVCVFTLILLAACSGIARSQDATSIISGLFSTFATSSSSPECSGECRHMLSALFCTYVDENANCGDTQLRCCAKPPNVLPQNRPHKPPNLLTDQNFPENEPSDRWSISATSVPLSVFDATEAPKDQKLEQSNKSSNFSMDKPPRKPPQRPQERPAPVLGVGSSISVGTNLTVRPGSHRRRPGHRRRTSTTTTTSTTETPQTSTISFLPNNYTPETNESDNETMGEAVPIPIAEALSGENPIKIKTGNNGADNNKPCNGICVSKMIASFCAEVLESSHCSPSEACCLTGSSSNEDSPSTTTKPSTRPTMTTTTMRSTPTTTTTERPRFTSTTIVPHSRNPAPPPAHRPDEEDSGLNECRGSCVMGLLSMLCDDIDNSVTCENGGQCCISKQDSAEMTPEEPIRTTTEPGPKNCPGICLPVLLSGVCNKPAILVPETKDCDPGKICCDNSLREVQTTTTTTTSPLFGLLKFAAGSMLGDMSSGNSGGGSDLASSATALLVPALAGLLSSGSNKSPTTTVQPPPQPHNMAMHKNGAPMDRPFSGQGQFSGPGQFNDVPHGGENVQQPFQRPHGPHGPLPPGAFPQPPFSQDSLQQGSHQQGQFSQDSHQQGSHQQGSLQQGQFSQGSLSAGSQQGTSQQGPSPQGPPPQGPPPQGPPPQLLPPSHQQQNFLQPPPSAFDSDQAFPPQPTDRPACTGTCIASFLKMTCFGLSQIAEQMSCPKQNLLCCAPKASLVATNVQSNPSSLNSNNWNTTFNSKFPNQSPNAQIASFSNKQSNKYVCGMKGPVRPETPRVVGGRDASPGEWCWQVALINSLNQYLCGGALIGRQWVLTAAHCVTNLIRSGDAIYIRVGDFDLTSKFGSPGAQTLKVATSYIHHNHNSQTLDNNIALLKLEKQVDLKEGVCLVCLPARGVTVEPGKTCVVTGYGYMGESGPIPLRIRSATLPIVSDQECVRKINSVTEKMFILPASSFCAGGQEGHDACQGDGGGPLSCEVDGYYEIAGLVSWGFGCGRADVPGIYVKVSSFIGWINQIISVNNE